MKVILLTSFLFIAGHALAEVDELIYQPRVVSPELKSDMDLEEHKWQLGLKLGQSLPSNQNWSGKIGFSAKYLVWDELYASANLDLNEWQITPNSTKSAIAWTFGAGYSVLQGAAYITDGLTLPWQAYLEVNIGEQLLDQDSGNIVSGAMGWQLSKDNNYAALEWRYFQINDERLKKIDSDKGYEWSVTFGRYF